MKIATKENYAIEWNNNIVDVERNEIDDKNVEFEKFEKFEKIEEIEFCLHFCDESTIWLIEIEIRMSNSIWLQKFLIWTNWIQLNLRRKRSWIDWKTNRNVEFKRFEKRRKNILICMCFTFFLNCFFRFQQINFFWCFE